MRSLSLAVFAVATIACDPVNISAVPPPNYPATTVVKVKPVRAEKPAVPTAAAPVPKPGQAQEPSTLKEHWPDRRPLSITVGDMPKSLPPTVFTVPDGWEVTRDEDVGIEKELTLENVGRKAEMFVMIRPATAVDFPIAACDRFAVDAIAVGHSVWRDTTITTDYSCDVAVSDGREIKVLRSDYLIGDTRFHVEIRGWEPLTDGYQQMLTDAAEMSENISAVPR